MRRKKTNRLRRGAALVLMAALCIGLAGCGGVVITTEDAMENVEDVDGETVVSDGERTTDGEKVTSDGTDVASGSGQASDGSNKERVGRASGEIPRAQDDYYGYVNKAALDSMEVNYKSTQLGSAADMQDAVNEEIAKMLVDVVSSETKYEAGSSEQLVRDFYIQMLDYLDGKECGAKDSFLRLTGDIRKISDVKGCKAMLKTLADEGILSVFPVDVGVNFFKGDENVAYLGQMTDIFDNSLKDIYEDDDKRQSLRDFVTDVLVAAGEEPRRAKEQATDFVYAMIDLGQATDFSIQDSATPYTTYIYRTNEEVDKLFDNISVDELNEIYKMGSAHQGWLVQDESQLKAIDNLFTDDNVEIVKTWMECQVLVEYKYFLEEDYDFLPKELHVAGQSHEQLACAAAGEVMTEAMNELYARYYYTEEMDEQITRMFDDIKSSYDELIQNADWLSKELRTRLRRKLDRMNFVKGGGTFAKPKPEDAKLIGADVFETFRNVHKLNVDNFEAVLSQKVDKDKSVMASYTVNSAYSPVNTFTITVAIMHAPYFDVNADYATNMGGLGMVMAHEMGHAFDSNHIAFDENGAYHPETISEEDMRRLEEECRKMEDYFSAFTVLKIYHVNGELTSGENYADKGAMECLMNIVKSPEERRKLFENYARIWMIMVQDTDILWDINEDEHSPYVVRVNGILSATPEFYELYDVKEGDGMYVEESKRVRRW